MAVLGALALVAQAPAAVSADHGGDSIGSLMRCDRPVTPPRCSSVGNDMWHFIYIDPSVPPELADSLRQAMAQAYDPTYLVLIEQPEITPATDAIAYAGDHGANGAAGWVYCPPQSPQGLNSRGDRWCQHQEIHFNLNARYAIFFDDDASRDHISCHELGHTIGLRHWGNPPESDAPRAATCMNADTPNGPTTLHPNDADHIRQYYAAAGSNARPARHSGVERPSAGTTGPGPDLWSGFQATGPAPDEWYVSPRRTGPRGG